MKFNEKINGHYYSLIEMDVNEFFTLNELKEALKDCGVEYRLFNSKVNAVKFFKENRGIRTFHWKKFNHNGTITYVLYEILFD